MDDDKIYTKSDIIDIINLGNKKGLINISGSKEDILNLLSQDNIDEVKSNNNLYNINHGSFFRLLVKNFDFNILFRCSTIGGLTKNIILLSEKASLYGYEEGDKGVNKLKGDLFEIFAELFFKLTSSDNRVGIRDYKPIEDSEDFGVDAIGVGENNDPVTVQVKFRSNMSELLTIKDIKNLQGLSYRKYKVPVQSDINIIIFTNCAGVHWNTETNVMQNSILVYGIFGESSQYNLTLLIDSNISFWKNLMTIVDYNINEIKTQCNN